MKQAPGAKIKRQGLHLAFSPNLTMNLTYLCYGDPKVQAFAEKVKAFGPTPVKSVEMRLSGALPTNMGEAGLQGGGILSEGSEKPGI